MQSGQLLHQYQKGWVVFWILTISLTEFVKTADLNKCICVGVSLVAQMVRSLPEGRRPRVRSLRWKILWRRRNGTPLKVFLLGNRGTEEPGGLVGGLKRVGYGW